MIKYKEEKAADLEGKCQAPTVLWKSLFMKFTIYEIQKGLR